MTPYGNHVRRGAVANQLQLSSGDKTATNEFSQNSSNAKQGTQHTNITHLFGELKTPDKVTFDYNSMVSENKNMVRKPGMAAFPNSQNKSSDKGGSCSIEK